MVNKVSVLMPVYNAEKFLDESISSILCQTFANFEFLILDDASNDASLTIIKKYTKQDSRIKVLENKKHQTAPVSRNILLKTAKTDFIAWMDADDISLPHRLQIQYQFLQENPEVDILGSKIKVWHNMPLSDYQIKSYLFLCGSPILNSSVMMRTKKIKEHQIYYNIVFSASQDYQFWIDCLPYCCFTNLNQVLVDYRRHSGQISFKNKEKQRSLHLKALHGHLKKFNINVKQNLLLILLSWHKKKITYQDLLDFKTDYFVPIMAIENFYNYKGVEKNLIAAVFYKITSQSYQDLGKKARYFFVKNYGLSFFWKLGIYQYFKNKIY